MDELSADLDGYLGAKRSSDPSSEVVAIIAPHAGYFYSGRVAGMAFSAVRDIQPEVVAVLSPMHQPCVAGFMTTGHSAYQTPLGNIPVDAGLVASLADRMLHSHGLNLVPVLHDQEHSLEIELPFLQRIYRHAFTLLPLMIHELSPDRCRKAGSALFEVLRGHRSLVVISTDLSHYHPQAEAQKLDACILDAILRLDMNGVAAVDANGTGYACGLGALMTGMHYASLCGCARATLLGYETSAASSGNYSAVVGYGAVALVKEK